MSSTISSKLGRIVQVAWSKITINGLATGTNKFIDAYQGFSRFYSRIGKITAPKQVVTSIKDWLFYPPEGYTNGLFTKPPGKYTGEMRKVIQAMIATGEYLHYEYKANLCHGVFTASDGVKWIIQIGSDGVVAAKMPLATHKSDNDWLGYTPAGVHTPIEEWEGYVVLTNYAGVYNFYSKSVLFPSCGWAFNSDGSEASNTCYTGGSGGPFGTASIGYVYTISITETNNAPALAVMTETESGSYALDRSRGLKHPNITDDALELDLSGWQNGQESIGSFNAPRYVFYDNDVLITIRSKKVSGARSTSDGGELDNSLPQPNAHYNQRYAGVTPCGFPDEEETFLLAPDAGGSYTVNLGGGSLETTGTVVGDNSLATATSGRSINCNFNTLGEYDWYAIYYAYPQGFPAKCVENDSYISVNGVQGVSFIIIPLHEREAVYQFTDTLQDGGCHTTVRDYLIGNGQVSRSIYPDNDCALGEVKDTLISENTQFRLSTDINHNRWKTTRPTGNCTNPSDTNNPPCSDYYIAVDDGYWGGNRTQTLRLISTGGVDTEVWRDSWAPHQDEWIEFTSSYTQDTDPQNPQWMYVHKDNSQNDTFFVSKFMNANYGNEMFSFGIDEQKYPVPTLTSSVTGNCFWVGDPHCLNGNCDE